MRAAGRDPGGGEIPMMRLSRPQFRLSPYEPGTAAALCAWGVVSNKAQKQKNLMSEAIGIALPAKALITNSHRRAVPIFVPLRRKSKEVRI